MWYAGMGKEGGCRRGLGLLSCAETWMLVWQYSQPAWSAASPDCTGRACLCFALHQCPHEVSEHHSMPGGASEVGPRPAVLLERATSL